MKKSILFICLFLGILGTLETTVSESTSGSGGTSLVTSRNDPNRRGDPDAANWDITVLDTAANADYLTGIEKDDKRAGSPRRSQSVS